MDVPSDDLIADMLAKQLGARLRAAGTLAAGATEVSQAIAHDYALHPPIFDGQDSTARDHTTPAQVVTPAAQGLEHAHGQRALRRTAVVGEQGTVTDIGVHTPAQGHCVAKTGTLNSVTNLAGYCRRAAVHAGVRADDRWSHELGVVPVLSRAVAAIARY